MCSTFVLGLEFVSFAGLFCRFYCNCLFVHSTVMYIRKIKVILAIVTLYRHLKNSGGFKGNRIRDLCDDP